MFGIGFVVFSILLVNERFCLFGDVVFNRILVLCMSGWFCFKWVLLSWVFLIFVLKLGEKVWFKREV